MRRPALAALVALAALTAAPAVAAADGAAVIIDCQDGRIDGTYTQKEFSDALRSIPTDADEYTDCRRVLRNAQLNSAGGGGGAIGGNTGGSGGTGTPGSSGNGGSGAPSSSGRGPTAAGLAQSASPKERAAIAEATGTGGAAPVRIGGRAVSANGSGRSPAGAANVVPTPLIVVLVLLAVGLLAGGTQTIRSLVLARRAPAT